MGPRRIVELALTALADPAADAQAHQILAELIKAMGLEPDAHEDAVMSAIEELISTMPPPEPAGDDALAEVPEEPAALSKQARAYCKSHGISHDDFRARKLSAVRRVTHGTEERASTDFDRDRVDQLTREIALDRKLKRAGMTREQYDRRIELSKLQMRGGN